MPVINEKWINKNGIKGNTRFCSCHGWNSQLQEKAAGIFDAFFGETVVFCYLKSMSKLQPLIFFSGFSMSRHGFIPIFKAFYHGSRAAGPSGRPRSPRHHHLELGQEVAGPAGHPAGIRRHPAGGGDRAIAGLEETRLAEASREMTKKNSWVFGRVFLWFFTW